MPESTIYPPGDKIKKAVQAFCRLLQEKPHKTRRQLLEEVDKIRHIPAVIVQGRYDLPCPVTTADALHRAALAELGDRFAIITTVDHIPST